MALDMQKGSLSQGQDPDIGQQGNKGIGMNGNRNKQTKESKSWMSTPPVSEAPAQVDK